MSDLGCQIAELLARKYIHDPVLTSAGTRHSGPAPGAKLRAQLSAETPVTGLGCGGGSDPSVVVVDVDREACHSQVVVAVLDLDLKKRKWPLARAEVASERKW